MANEGLPLPRVREFCLLRVLEKGDSKGDSPDLKRAPHAGFNPGVIDF